MAFILPITAVLAALTAPAPASAPGAAGPAPNVSPATLQAINWARSELHLSGWRLLSATPDLIILAKAADMTPDGSPTIMIRGEHVPMALQNPIGSGESFTNVAEVDCAGARERTLHATVYAAADLQGAIVAGSDTVGPWAKMTPTSPAGVEAAIVCAKSAPSPAAPAKAPQTGH